MRAVRQKDGAESEWSGPATVVTWARVFTAGLKQVGVNDSKPGACIVQRLSPGTLTHGGNLIAITVRSAIDAEVGPGVGVGGGGGGSVVNLVLSRVTISAPALSGDDFDSAAHAKNVTAGGNLTIVVKADETKRLDQVEFNVDADEALLIAFDVGNTGNARFASPVPHTMYIKQPLLGEPPIEEVIVQNRAGFEEHPNELWFIETIDLATKWPPIP